MEQVLPSTSLSCKVQRSKNFKDSEVNLLLQLVDMYKDILECKKTDHVSVKDKERVWGVIERKFNEGSGVYHRDSKTLKGKYENLKKVSKRKFSDEKKYVLGTGGGPHIKTDITETDMKVKNIIGDLPVFGDSSRFDSDAVSASNKEDLGLTMEEALGVTIHLSEIPIIIDGQEVDFGMKTPPPIDAKPTSSGKFSVIDSPSKVSGSIGENENYVHKSQSPNHGFKSSFNVKDLRNRTSSPLTIRKKKSALDTTQAGKKIEILSKSKTELIELQKTLTEKQIFFLEEEHNMKMKMLQEKHELKLELLKTQIECLKNKL